MQVLTPPSAPMEQMCCRYVKTHGALEAKDSWFIRACFTHARILTHQNKGLKGKALVEESERAMNVILQGIQIAKESKRYSHLVYNGSVCFWQAARPLMRRDRWQHVHTQLGQVLAAVEDLAGHIQWKATISAAMAQCSAAVRILCTKPCFCTCAAEYLHEVSKIAKMCNQIVSHSLEGLTFNVDWDLYVGCSVMPTPHVPLIMQSSSFLFNVQNDSS